MSVNEAQKVKDLKYQHFLMDRKVFLAEKQFYIKRQEYTTNEVNYLQNILKNFKKELRGGLAEQKQIFLKYNKNKDGHETLAQEHDDKMKADLEQIKNKKLEHAESKTSFGNKLEFDQAAQSYATNQHLNHVDAYKLAKEKFEQQKIAYIADNMNLEQELDDHAKQKALHEIKTDRHDQNVQKAKDLILSQEKHQAGVEEINKKHMLDVKQHMEELLGEYDTHNESTKQHKNNVRRASQEIDIENMHIMVMNDAGENEMEAHIEEHKKKTKDLNEKTKNLDDLEKGVRPMIAKMKKNQSLEQKIQNKLENHQKKSKAHEIKVLESLKKVVKS